MKRLYLLALAVGLTLQAGAQSKKGGIDASMLREIQQGYQGTAADKAIRNAIGSLDINKLAVNQENQKPMDTHFSVEVPTKGISNQKQSGRCWLFSGLNVMRSKAIAKYGLPDFQYSQCYTFFWDQLEKSNLFLQGIIDTRNKPMDDMMVDWLFRNPIGDGGTFCGVADLVTKYGLVPEEVMPESRSANATSQMSKILRLKLREDGLRLRQMSEAGKSVSDLEAEKKEMLKTVYRILVLNLGVPPTSFDFARKNAKGEVVEVEHHTPMTFLQKYGDTGVLTDYVMLMNDPSREYYKVYQIDFDRHVYDGQDWTYLNLPMDEIKQIAIASLKEKNSMYFSCDVNQSLDRPRGLADLKNYDYESLFGTTFGMNKKERIQTHASGSTHAMCLMAVDLDAQGKPTKWKVENSWGKDTGVGGYLIMTDEWFDEYMFRLVVGKKYLTAKQLDLWKQKPIMLPAWDPMYLWDE